MYNSAIAVSVALIPVRAYSQGGGLEARSDSALFAAVVREVIAHGFRGQLAIDPRPLEADPSIISGSPLNRADVSPERVENRLTILRQFGIVPADSAVSGGCPGRLAPSTPMEEANKAVTCPKVNLTRVAIGLPRPGGAWLPDGGIDEHNSGIDAGQVAVRVITVDLNPHGSVTDIDDIVLRPDGTHWLIVKRVELLAMH